MPQTMRRRLTVHDLQRVNLGRAYWNVSLTGIQDDEVRGRIEQYLSRLPEMILTGSGLVVCGRRGVGKTGTAILTLMEAVRRGYTAYFVTHHELRELVFEKKIFGDGSDGLTVNQKIKDVDFLVVDGFDDPFLIDRAFGPLQMEQLLRQRNAQRRTTVMTTRVAKRLQQDEYRDLFDVISETMVPITIRGENLRDNLREDLKARVFDN